MTYKKWREVYVEKIHQYKSDKYNVCRDNLDCYDYPNIPTKYLKFIEHEAYQELKQELNQKVYELDKSRASHMKIIEDLERKLEKAREALEFYANDNNWWWKSDVAWDDGKKLTSRIIASEDLSITKNCKMDGCGGKRARQALAEINSPTEVDAGSDTTGGCKEDE